MKQTVAKSSKTLILCAFLSLMVFASVPQAQAVTVTQTRYLGSAGLEFALGLFGYTNLRNLTASDSFWYYEKNFTTIYAGNFQLGFQAYRDIYDADLTPIVDYEELTSGRTVLYTESENFEGWLSTTWDSPAVNLSRLDFLQLGLRVRFQLSSSIWSSWYPLEWHSSGVLLYFSDSIFSEPLCMDKLLASAWNFTFYLWAQRIGTANSVRIYLGNSTYSSGISNMQFDNGIIEPTEPENMEQYFLLGGSMTFLIGFGIVLTRRKRLGHE